MQKHPMRRPYPAAPAEPGFDRNTHNVWGQPVKPKPYRPPQTAELAVIDEAAPAAEQVDFRPGVGIPFAVTEEVVRHNVHYVWPIVHPQFGYRSGPAPLPQAGIHEPPHISARQDRAPRARETLLWLLMGALAGGIAGALAAIAVALILL